MNDQFDKLWSGVKYQELSVQKLKVAEEFLKPLIDKINASPVVLKICDGGCGDGVHACVLAEKTNKNFDYLGLDISEVAITASRSRLAGDNRFRFKVADISEHDCTTEFDIVFSYGVIAYTQSPKDTVENLASMLCKDGMFLVWIYTPRALERIVLQLVRIGGRMIGVRGTDVLATMIVYAMEYLPISSGVNLSNSTFDQCKETVLVNISPKRLALPKMSDTEDWCLSAGLKKGEDGVYVKS